MPDVDLRFNSYSSYHSKSISFYKKAKNAGIGKTWDYSGMSPTGLYECLIVHRKNVEFFQRVLSGWDVSYEI